MTWRGKYFRFIWDGQEEKAKIIKRIGEERARFQWDYDEDEVEEQKMFWENQISELKKVLGSR